MVMMFAGISNAWFMLAGISLFLAVQIEDRSMLFHAVVESVRLEDIMLTEFATLSPADTLQDALHKAVHTLQDDFPVIRGSDLVGVINKQGIIAALRDNGNGYVQSAMARVQDVCHRGESLGVAFRKITAQGATLIPVVDNDRLIGIVTLQNVMHSMGLIAESRRLRRTNEPGPEA
jgi:CBS domain-containing protein